MIRVWLTVFGVLAATSVFAQDIEVTTLEPSNPEAVLEEILPEEKAEIPTLSIGQVILRGIDKLNGTADNIVVATDLPRKFGLLDIELKECRYPQDNPTGEAFAFLFIKEASETVFSGWMVASSPALNALDHQRYDIWVQRCRVSLAAGGDE
ncbi:MAG: DUF2155 domain-containing protein [Paracoccaceae bacterium]|nr:DUF2155 domain-containing protein [Paracoccaceae bacterium]MDG2257365.1 DUF2155 domain-containing protein [Paracoccaceae bacterium]